MLTLVLAAVLSAAPATAPDPRAPWSVNAHAPVTPEAARLERASPGGAAPETNVPKLFLLGAVRAYQVGISPADGASCRMYPTCSGYAVHALRAHGPIVGFVMTAERVMRNHGGAQYPPIEKFGVWRLHDPVEANDFWFPGVRRRLLAALEAREAEALARRRAAGLEGAP